MPDPLADPNAIETQNATFARYVLLTLNENRILAGSPDLTVQQETDLAWVAGIFSSPPGVLVTPADYLAHNIDTDPVEWT